LLDDQVVPFEFAGVRSGAESTGPRGMGSPRFIVDHADHYEALLAGQHILGNRAARRAEVKRQIEAMAATVDGRVAENDALLDEVTDLVEQPAALLCRFDPEFLELPAPILISVMSKKQRYFTVLKADSAGEQSVLLPCFITVRNGPADDADEVRKGNEDVVRARFADAAYFFRDDLQKPLESFLPRLDTITFQARLGSMLDKAKRIEALIEPITNLLNAAHSASTANQQSQIQDPKSKIIEVARAAARLCKADLATSMVVEITALQGVMGREYYLRQHPQRTPEDVAIAEAIFEHYLPRYAGDKRPATLPGLIVGLADKLDSIAGLFAVGLAPKGSADPFALRRAAIGIVQNLIAAGQSFSLREGLEQAARLLPVQISPDALNAAHTFIVERARQQLLDEGFRYDIVDAVLAKQGDDPWRARRNVIQLSEWARRADWQQTLAAYSRCARIIKSAKQRDDAQPAVAYQDEEPASQALAAALDALPPAPYRDVDEMMYCLSRLTEPITSFFDKVLVMAEDEAARRSRLALVGRVVGLADGVADLSRLEGF
ncbi:MAG: glycine--tRNA ligase subunit beta, partial [Candidatus Roseilinea sp.]|uniref:glycine--tRNA ligase subunit beta n=1 Tax=Candidatus Roseilinea sp. TaxID=2838777 RepID=UPI0040494B19